MLLRFKLFAMKSKTVAILYHMYANWKTRWRFRSGNIATTSGSTHSRFSVPESLQYIDTVFLDYLTYSGTTLENLQRKRLLELGPGDNLGVAMMFLVAGAEQVVCVDKFHAARDSECERRIYSALRESLNEPEKQALDRVVRLDEGISVNPNRLLCIHGKGIEEAANTLEPASFDLIFSRAVLEHVYNIDASFSAMDRLLAPGGRMVHKIDFRDHGMFSSIGFHPLTFLTISDKVYSLMTRDSGKPNRKLIGHYRQRMNELGYQSTILITRVLGSEEDIQPHKETITPGVDYTDSTMALLNEIRPALQEPFRNMPDEELIIQGIFLIARKPG
ncbi:MAG: methyltransferase domain-containing protein [bacterium]